MDPGSLLLPPEALRLPCLADGLGVVSSDELEPPDGPVGQDAALEALDVGLSVRGPGFHVYVSGPPGTGRRTAVRAVLDRVAASLPVPPDRVHVPRFDDPQRPRLLTLEPGRAVRFGALVEEFSRALALRAGALLEDRGVERRREALGHRFRADEEARLADLRARMARVDVALVVDESSVPQPFEVIPTHEGGPVSLERLEELRGAEAAAAMRDTLVRATEALRDHLRDARARRRVLDEQLRGTYERAARTIVDEELHVVADEFSGPVLDLFLADVRLDAIDGLADYAEGGADAGLRLQARLQRYGPSLTADRTGLDRAPTVFDDAPTRESLFGAIPAALDGPIGLQVDLSRITTGSVLRADGGFLVLDADDVLGDPEAWEPLRRVLRSGRYEPGVGAPRAVEPEAVPVDVKLVLIGSRERFEEMARSDAVFRKSFGVRADFRSDTPRTAEAERTFARVAAAVSRKAGLPAVDADGLAALVEAGAELAGRRDRLTTSFAAVERVLQEAAFRARGRDAGTIGRPDVEAARQAQARRDDHDPDPRAVSRLLSVDDVGAGRVLTLEPVAPGSVANGGVLRVTVAARAADPGGTRVVRVGTGARPAPDAGVLLLEAWIGHRFPGLALTVTVVAEGAHGLEELPPAAATAAEAVALVSALAGLPADPSTAVVGALAPDGTVGTAGGLGDRLRVFHDLLRRAGDTQPRAVVVPAVEAGSLMLPAALVADAAAGRFGVHAVSRIDQAVELVLGVGPEEVDARVAERLAGRTPAAV